MSSSNLNPPQNPKSGPSKPPPVIPSRTSSKRPLQTDAQLDYQLLKTQTEFKKLKQNLKPETSFDSYYWEQAMEMATLGRTSSQIELYRAANKYMAAGQGSEEDFMNTPTARPLQEQLKVWETKRNIYRTRAIELKKSSKNPEGRTCRVFMQLFTSSPLGLNIKETIAGRRDTKIQVDFRKEIIQRYGLASPNIPKFLWNLVSQRYEPASSFTASHIVAWRHGQEMMTAIFGPEAQDELFSAANGLLLPNGIEEEFESGMMAIVPAIKDPTSKAEVTLWQSQEPREYKFKIFDDGRSTLDDIPLDPSTTDGVALRFRDLHDRKLSFPGKFRPRARYLYFHYCCQVLRYAWNKGAHAKSVPTMVEQKGMFAWGTVGKYMAQDQMRAFVEELGHEFEPLMQNADASLNTEADKHVFVDAAAQQIAINAKKQTGDDEEEDDE